jgi:hypothetical protein
MKRISAILFVVTALLMYLAPAATAAPPERSVYIVVLHDDEPSPAAAAREIAAQFGGEVGFVYSHAIKGFSITVPPQAVSGIERNPRVKYVEADQLHYAVAQTVPTGIQRIFAPKNTNIGIDGSDDMRVDVDVAVIDTGIDFQHPDLNVVGGINCTVSIFNPTCVSGGDDDHYHGTHVAGTIGALDNGEGVVGVAPGARLWAVKVLNKRGSGYTSWIVAGIDWVADPIHGIEVANMSLGGAGFIQSEYEAIQGAVNNGVAFAVAAGNEDDDANNYSPGGFDNVLSVSALADFNGLPDGGAASTCYSDVDDTLANFSNWGPEVDIAAPGVCILSTYPLEKGSYGTISGTSMASPHVAGALALLASRSNPANVTDVNNLYRAVESAGNYNWVDDSDDGIQEPLLDVSNTAIFNPVLVPGGDTGDTNTPPVVTIISPAGDTTIPLGTTITFTGTANDAEDGNLTAFLEWKDGEAQIGIGGDVDATLSEGIHEITATVTDSSELPGSDSVTITVVPSEVIPVITLSVTPYTQGVNYANLTWEGARYANVDIYRNGKKLVTTPNDEAYTDKVGKTTSAIYMVCEEGTTEYCSPPVLVTWLP